jgi:hypothetical protein
MYYLKFNNPQVGSITEWRWESDLEDQAMKIIQYEEQQVKNTEEEIIEF